MPDVRGSGSFSAMTTRAGLAFKQKIGAGGPARAVMRAGFEGDIDGRAARALAGLIERHSFGVGPSAGRRRAFADDSAAWSDTITQPTLGLGAERPRASWPSATASAMKRALAIHIPSSFLELLILPLLLFLRCDLRQHVLLLVGDDLGIRPVRRIQLDLR